MPKSDAVPCWLKRLPDSEWEEGTAYAFEGPCGGSLAPVCIVSAKFDAATLALSLAQVALTEENPDELKAKNEKAAAAKAEKELKEQQAAEEKESKRLHAEAAKAEAAAHEAAHPHQAAHARH